MSNYDAASLFFTSSASSYAYVFTISSNSDSEFYSCSGLQTPSPILSPTPIPSPSSSPSPSPTPQPRSPPQLSPSPQPSPSPPADPTPQPGPSQSPSISPPRNRSPPRLRRPPPRKPTPRRPPPRKTPLRSPPPRKPTPRRPPPRKTSLRSPPFHIPPFHRPPPLFSPALPSPPPPPSPSPTFPNPPPPAASQWLSPGVDFILIIPGYTTANFDTVQKNALCVAITNSWASSGSTTGTACSISSIKAFESSSVLVSGYAYFTFSDTPTVVQLQTAAVLRDARIIALTTNIGSVLGGSYPTAVPYCACKGFNLVTTSITSSFNYAAIIYDVGVPGPIQCDAKLTYDNNNANAIISQVGVDDGSVNFSSLGKYCSTPAVNGGVLGFPGSGSCRQYGVIGVETVGKLCSPTPIATLPPSIAYEVPTAISFSGPCRPLGRNTYLNRVCSTPSAPGGVFEILNAGNCNVQSSFIAQPGSAVTNACGILPQSFVATTRKTDSA